VNVLALLAPAFQQGDDGAVLVAQLPGLIIGIFVVVCLWKIFGKAGQPGWYSLIPIWNTITMLKIAGRPWWWIFLFFIPFLNIIFFIMAIISLGNSFGKGAAFSIFLLMCLSPIGMGILAFGGSPYLGPGGRRA
jgi:hypothetical protein